MSLEGVIALVLTFAFFRTLLKYRHERKMRELDAKHPTTVPPQLLEASQQQQALLNQAHHQVVALSSAKIQLEERVRNLESIVCSVDFELNAKLNRLASRQLQLSSAGRAAGAAASMAAGAGAAQAQGAAETEAFALGSIEPGKRVAGRFVVERRLGVGGMGAVYLAHDEQLGEKVALKVIAGAALLDPEAADRFRREASTARRISHDNVVRLHDIGEENGMLFLSMEYIAGESLAELLQRYGTIPLPQLRPMLAQVCDGLEAAHRAGVVHRDLKPANILLTREQRIKIIDFGLARLPHLEGMTATGMIIGTPEYMAPEQVRGRPVDPRTDIYALGAVIYHALTGVPPFRGDSAIAVGFKHCTEPPMPPHQVRAEVPLAWSQLVLTAMAKDPQARFASAAELAAALPSI